VQLLNGIGEIGGSGSAPAANSGAQVASTRATDAFGLSFEALLKIVLTQLTYQDPLKPMDNFQFVSQLAQFSQIQQSQEMVESLAVLARAQATNQAAGLLGKAVDVSAGAGTLSGHVVAVSFESGAPTLTIQTDEGQTVSSLPLASVSQIREAE
jgi:flagellar basal-body rod modification protein FlgD